VELYRTPGTPPPDPPQALTWQETEDAVGVRVDFSAARASIALALMAWAFLASVIGMLVFLEAQVVHGGAVALLVFVPFILAGVLLSVKTWPYPSRGRLVIADGRISLGGLRAPIDIASIDEIVCVDGEREYFVNDERRTVRWFDAVARTKRGERVLARFAERECAAFFCERVCVLAKVPHG